MMFWERLLSKRNYLQGQVLHRGVHYQQSTRTPFKYQIIEGQLSVETVTPLCNDILVNWDTTYSQNHFGTCKDCDGPVDKECNCQTPATKFNQVPLMQNLVDMFCVIFPYLTDDMVWIIDKSKPGSGFQSWHRDSYLDEMIVKTRVVLRFSIFGQYWLVFSWYFTNRYQRKTRLEHFGIVNLVGTSFSLKRGALAPLFMQP